MKNTLTILLLFLCTNLSAQRIRFSPPETRYDAFSSYNIIGQVNGHLLIYIEGLHGAEIGVYDDDMNKVKSVPVSFLKTSVLHKNFFVYPDHFLAFFQYHIDSIYYCSMVKINGEGQLLEGPIVMDSIILPARKNHSASGGPGNTDQNFPMHIVLRSENKKWFMILKGAGTDEKDKQLETTLFDKDLHPVEHVRFTYSRTNAPDEFSEFTLNNEGDLAFIHSSFENGDTQDHTRANLFFIPNGNDSIYSTDLSVPGAVLDGPNIRVDNANHRYILNSLYKKSGSTYLTGLCSLIWDEQKRAMSSTTLTPLSPDLLAQARSDFSPPEQVLNNYHLRHVFPFADGGFLVLAEMCYGSERVISNFTGMRTYDFIQWKSPLFAPWYQSIFYRDREKPGYWQPHGRDMLGSRGAYGEGKNTDNLLVFTMDRDGKVRSIKVIHKSEYTTPGVETLSFQALNDGKAIHLIYNEHLKGHWLPTGTSIRIDGTIVPEPVMHSLDREQVLFPRYGEQVGPKTAIIPCQNRGFLGFARVDMD